MFRFVHAADFHLDSAFRALSPRQAAARRRESRELPQRLANYVNQNNIDLVLLSGDLLDSNAGYRETAEALRDALASMDVPVFIAPGNHDWYGTGSPYMTMDWPENVHIFSEEALTYVEIPALNAVVYGAAFTGAERHSRVLEDFAAPTDGRTHIGVLHGEFGAADTRYGAISQQEAADSGLDYLALGHIHKRSEPVQCGKTTVAWPGCPEGRGFDELGEKGVYVGTVADHGTVSLEFVPFARHRYQILQVDVTDREPREAVEAVLPEGTSRDLYRVILTGETGEDGVDAAALQTALADRFYALEIRDATRPAEDLWARAEEDSLRGLFLRELREKYKAAETDAERETVIRAVRFGLAALEGRDLG